MKKLLVISGKGGTGKTTVSSAIIQYLKVKAFADCDVDAPNLHLINGFNGDKITSDFIGSEKAFVKQELCTGCGICKENCRFDSIDIVKGKSIISEYSCEGCGVCEYLCPEKAIEMKPDIAGKLELYKDERTFSTAELKMGRGNSGKLVSKVKENLFKNIEEVPLAVLDGSPGTGCPVMASLNGTDMALVVTEPTLSGKSDLERIAKTVRMSGVQLCVCVNKFDINKEMSHEIEKWCEENQINFLDLIPYDKRASSEINRGKSIIEIDCETSKALKRISEKVLKLMGG